MPLKNMSTSTVRRLYEAGLYGKIVVKKLQLTKQNNVEFAQGEGQIELDQLSLNIAASHYPI